MGGGTNITNPVRQRLRDLINDYDVDISDLGDIGETKVNYTSSQAQRLNQIQTGRQNLITYVFVTLFGTDDFSAIINRGVLPIFFDIVTGTKCHNESAANLRQVLGLR